MGGKNSQVSQSNIYSNNMTSLNPAGQYAQFLDKYKTFQELEQALRNANVESMQLVMGFDFSKSNEWTGERTYQQPLHGLNYNNPYMQVMTILQPIISKFDDDGIIPAFRFGCTQTRDQLVFPLGAPQNPDPHFAGFGALLEGYKAAVQTVTLSGPTTFGPMVQQAVQISQAYNHKQLLICILMTDGDVNNINADLQAIAAASSYPICFTAVGLGDGPFDKMQMFDDNQSGRRFDNFQFVNFTEMAQKIQGRCENPELALACAVFNELPDAVKQMKQQGIM